MRNRKTALCAMVFCALLAGCIQFGAPALPVQGMVTAPAGSSGTVPMLLDDDRVFVELEAVRPDGTTRKLLAFVNMGQPSPNIGTALYRELGIGEGRALELRFGGMPIRIEAAAIRASDGAAQLFAPLPAEMMLPAGVLQNFQMVLDYRARTMTLAAPGTLKPEGTPTLLIRNPATGLVTMEARVDGKPYRFVIDNGGYTVFRADAVQQMLKAHPDWLRAGSAIGGANVTIDSSGFDVGAPVLKLPRIAAGTLTLEKVGVSGAGMGTTLGTVIAPLFWNQYSDKAGLRIDGWLGGNALKHYRLTIDYAAHMAWWLRQSPGDDDEFNQVGITLGRDQGRYTVNAIATKNGRPTVSGVEPGDFLVAIDQVQTAPLTRGQILSALHGKPGEMRRLVLERGGRRLEVDVPVTAF